MRPLILIYFSIGVVYGNPYPLNYPTPTPSAAPATLANVPNPTPSIAPSLLIENVPYSGQFGIPPVVRIEGKPQSLVLNQPQFGLPFGDLGFNFAQPAFNFAQQGFNFAQPGLNFAQPGSNFAQPGYNFAQPGYSFAQPGYNFGQPGLNFGEQFFNIGGPQLTFGAGPSTGLNSAQFTAAPVEPTPNERPNVAPTRPTPDIATNPPRVNVSPAQVSVSPAQVNVSPTQVNVSPAQVNVSPAQLNVSPAQLNGSPIKSTPSPSRVEYFTEEKNVASSSDGATVHKHIYFHVPPSEPEIEQSPRVIVPPPRKHLRIIFIKAPAPPKPVVSVPPPNDDRTIVYVLARKPDVQQEIKIETTTPTVPPKPEVYFIRYDAQKQSVADTSAGTSEKAQGSQTAVTENPTYKIDTRFNPDAVDDSEGIKAVTLNLNEASLTGGSALSQAVTGSPDDNSVLVSSTPETNYDSAPQHK